MNKYSCEFCMKFKSDKLIYKQVDRDSYECKDIKENENYAIFIIVVSLFIIVWAEDDVSEVRFGSIIIYC